MVTLVVDFTLNIILIAMICQSVFCAMDTTWWKYTTIYEVYLPSFKDSNGDGKGDIKGLTMKLDHFVESGIETIYITPFYVSPMEDGGYDIANFTAIDPTYGTMDDFNELIAEAKSRRLKVIIDVILNHSSDRHPWFINSVNRVEPFTDFYVWQDAKNDSKGNRIPPNNWVTAFGGSAWEWNEQRKQFYLHQFTRQQVDFNLRNRVLRKELKKILKFWLDKEVSGFRLDATRYLFEDDQFRDDPVSSPDIKTPYAYSDLTHLYTADLPESYSFLHDIRQYCDRATKKFNDYERILVPEAYIFGKELIKYYGRSDYKITHFPVNFAFVMLVQFENAAFFHNLINDYLNSLPEGATPCWNSENHDRFRKAIVYNEEYEYIFTIMIMMLPGVAYVYYGQEIGMTGSRIRSDQQVDKYVDDFTKTTRDSYRLPMQWNDCLNAGFSNNPRTFLPVSPNYWKINVKQQKEDKNSHYWMFKKIMDLRKTETLKFGGFRSYVISTWVFAFTRSLEGRELYLTIMNLGSETEFVDLANSIHILPDVMKVESASPNSGYKVGDKIPTVTTIPQILILRPLAIMVLSSNLLENSANSS